MLLGTPNLYTISLVNSTALATVMEAAGFCEFMHYYKDMCESPFGFLEWTYQIQPPC
jgi:hypothetical protein